MIDNNLISPFAISIIEKLSRHNHQAYLVGGCIRDILSNIKPKDFDIATNATPEEIRKIFKASRIIGKRFKLVHIYKGTEIIEVATFRSGNDKDQSSNFLQKDGSGKIIRDNIWGTIEDDSLRRDFTINSLYYCPTSKKIIDKNNGQQDIRKKKIVSIGDPIKRFEEDPVRCLRAIRFSNKLKFKIDNQIKDAIYKKGHLLKDISNARMFDEFCKLFMNGFAYPNFKKINTFSLDQVFIEQYKNTIWQKICIESMKNTDNRLNNGKTANPGFLLAAIMWPSLLSHCIDKNQINLKKFFRNMDKVIKNQQKRTAIPRKFFSYIKDIWFLQLKLHSRIKNHPYKTLKNSRFRAAYDFLLIREKACNIKDGPGSWWTKFQEFDKQGKENLIKELKDKQDEESFKSFGFQRELI